MVTIYDTCGEVLKVYEDLDTLVGADLSYEDLMFADFRDMDLRDVNFEHAELYGAEFDGADVEGANFDHTVYEVVCSGGMRRFAGFHSGGLHL